MTLRASLLLFASTLSLVGCADEATDPGALEFRDTWGCGGCGSNSPRVNDYPIPELGLVGQVNDAGIRLEGIRAPDQSVYGVTVVDDEFAALDGNGVVVDAGGDLVGWELLVNDGSTVRALTIEDYEAENASWAAGADPISTYAISYVGDGYPLEIYNVCPDHRDQPTATVLTLIAGERYDAARKEVVADQPDWVTLACEGEASFKMKRLNYGPSDDFDGEGNPATVAQRQATLKMITADYCGTGQSFTAQGTSLYWENFGGSVDPSVPPSADVEAVWSPAGALCLGTPRHALPSEIAAECVLPACDGPLVLGEDREWLTWTP